MGRWRGHLRFLFLILLLPLTGGTPVQVPVGVVLRMGSVVGRTGMAGLRMALEDFYAAYPNYCTRIHFLPRDYDHGDIVTATFAVISLVKNEGVPAIIGPQDSGAAEFTADLANRTRVPVLSFSATSPSLSSRNTPYFIRTAVNDSAQAAPIAALVRTFNWKQAVPIYQDSKYGSALIPFLIDALREVECRVPYRSVIPTSPSDDFLKQELYKLKSMQTRVFIVHMVRELGTRLLSLAHEVDMMGEGYAWIVTDSPSAFTTMQGVIGLKPYVGRSERLDQFRSKWKRQHRAEEPEEAAPSQFVLWAYDTATALAIAVEQAGISRPAAASNSLLSRNESSVHDLAALGVSPTGPRLLDAISTVQFDGLAGRFELVNGQLGCEAFEIVYVTGKTERTIGFWTKRGRLSRQLDGGGGIGKNGELLAPVVWPGETVAVPRGWERPVSGRKMKIAVPGPVDPGFHPFLRMDWNPKTNTSTVEGFVIDVFQAAVEQLPYAILWEYVPFQTKDGNSAGNYDQLIRNVSAGAFDGVVGDVTITDERAAYMDFTMPYTTSGVSMVVPKREYPSRSAWIFLRPLTASLWMVSCAFFLATGGVIWLLEHRINEEFRGRFSQQLGTVLCFSFSTLVFAHREQIVGNLSRLVLVVWLFVVLILQSSYTASLTSMLTVKQLQPTVTEISYLVNTNQRVGYLKDSFVKRKLLDMKFKEANLVPVRSPQEYAKMLALGSSHGGVAAVIDETPYLKLFLKDYCANYTMTGQQLKTGGFGFAFPRGSPLVPDLSRVILNITEGDTMAEIERKWLGDLTSCADAGSPISSDGLGFVSFWTLFLITGSVTICTFAFYVARFFYKRRSILRQNGGDGSTRSRVEKFVTIAWEYFDQKDPRTQETSQHGDETPLSMSVRVAGGAAMPPPAESYGPSTPTRVLSDETFGGGTYSTPPCPPGSPSSEPETPVAVNMGGGIATSGGSCNVRDFNAT